MYMFSALNFPYTVCTLTEVCVLGKRPRRTPFDLITHFEVCAVPTDSRHFFVIRVGPVTEIYDVVQPPGDVVCVLLCFSRMQREINTESWLPANGLPVQGLGFST